MKKEIKILLYTIISIGIILSIYIRYLYGKDIIDGTAALLLNTPIVVFVLISLWKLDVKKKEIKKIIYLLKKAVV